MQRCLDETAHSPDYFFVLFVKWHESFHQAEVLRMKFRVSVVCMRVHTFPWLWLCMCVCNVFFFSFFFSIFALQFSRLTVAIYMYMEKTLSFFLFIVKRECGAIVHHFIDACLEKQLHRAKCKMTGMERRKSRITSVQDVWRMCRWV